jgi:hypothetical protein
MKDIDPVEELRKIRRAICKRLMAPRQPMPAITSKWTK